MNEESYFTYDEAEKLCDSVKFIDSLFLQKQLSKNCKRFFDYKKQLKFAIHINNTFRIDIDIHIDYEFKHLY